jgi:hypothetical protein
MVSTTIHVRQVLGEWHLVATITEHYGKGLEPAVSRTVWLSPLTGPEWDSDPLSAVLSAIQRWSGMTMEDRRQIH